MVLNLGENFDEKQDIWMVLKYSPHTTYYLQEFQKQ